MEQLNKRLIFIRETIRGELLSAYMDYMTDTISSRDIRPLEKLYLKACKLQVLVEAQIKL